MNLPVKYSTLGRNRWKVREEYVRQQGGKCMYCAEPLSQPPPKRITELPINWKLFPPGFLKSPIHLQHNHATDLTEGAIHAYCNAVLWQYAGR